MQIEVGKRYVMRDGNVSGLLQYRLGDTYPFLCPVNNRMYAVKGERYIGKEHPTDLVAEYVEPVSPSEVSGKESVVEYDLSGIPAGYEFVGVRAVKVGDCYLPNMDNSHAWRARIQDTVVGCVRVVVKPIEPKQRTVVIHKWLVWDLLGKERMVFGTKKYIGDCGFSDAVDLGIYEEVKVNV